MQAPVPAVFRFRAAPAAARLFPALLAAAIAAGAAPVRAQDAAAGSGEDGGGARVAVPVDSPAVREFDLVRSESDEKAVYELELGIPGRKIPLSARLPLEPGQGAATLTLSVKEREGRRAASVALPPLPGGAPSEPPRLPLGLFSGKPASVRLVRTDASAPADYELDVLNGEPGNFSLSTNRLSFAAGQAEASFEATANPSRLERMELRVSRAGDAGDRLRLALPVVRGPLAAFENNFHVCFVKKIPFGTVEVPVLDENGAPVLEPDGTPKTRREQVYKGRWHYITNGLRNTLTVALCAVMLGAVLGFLVAIVRSTHDKHGRLALLNALAKVYITVIRGTPMTVQLLIAYFIIFSSLNNKVLVAILAFGFNSGAYVAEIIRAGITSIDDGQMEAARSLGLSYGQGMRLVVLPQAIRNILPALGNEFIVMLKDTSIASFIGLDDLARGGSIIRSQTYQAYIPFLAVAAIYLVMVMIFSKLLTRLERHLHRTGGA